MLRPLARDSRGSMVVETALVLPVLLLLGLGSFQVGELVVRQAELESAASEATQIALASKPDTPAKLYTVKLVLMTSTGITDPNKINLAFKYRCGTSTSLTNDSGSCGSDPAWNFVQVNVRETYVPLWTSFGVGSNINLRVTRTVQIS